MSTASANPDQVVDILDSDGLLQGGSWTSIVDGDVWAAGQAEFNQRAAKFGVSLSPSPIGVNIPTSAQNAQRLSTASAVDAWIDQWAPIQSAGASSPPGGSASSASSSGPSGTVIAVATTGAVVVGLGTFLWWRYRRAA